MYRISKALLYSFSGCCFSSSFFSSGRAFFAGPFFSFSGAFFSSFFLSGGGSFPSNLSFFAFRKKINQNSILSELFFTFLFWRSASVIIWENAFAKTLEFNSVMPTIDSMYLASFFCFSVKAVGST